MTNNLNSQAHNINPYYLSPTYFSGEKSTGNSKAIEKKNPTLLLIPELLGGKPSPCSYIRLLIPLCSTKIQADFDVRISSLKSALSISADIIVINRVPCEDVRELEDLLHHIRNTNAKLIYDIDDQLLDLGSDHPEVNLYKDRQAVVLRLLSAADLVCTSTTHLADALRPLTKKIITIANQLEAQPPNVYSAPLPHLSNERRKFSILYMGTTTHSKDLALVVDAFQALHEGGLEFDLSIIGVSTTIPTYSWMKAIYPPPFASTYPKFMQWLRSLKMFDLGIAPLESNHFNQCKSAIKFLDYTSLSIPTLASDVEAYNGTIIDGKNGYLAKNSKEAWQDKIRQIINDREQLGIIYQQAMRTTEDLRENINAVETRSRVIFELLNSNTEREIELQFSQSNMSPVSRELLATAFLSGEGIEIGALHNPLQLPKTANVKYVDRMPKEKLYEHYPELRPYNLVNVDIVDDGEFLHSISDNSKDFLIANHFLEHSENPIITMQNLLRVIKPGGILYLAIPEMKKTFDADRDETTNEHLINDHEQGVKISRRKHYEDWVGLIEPHFGRLYDQVAKDLRVEELLSQRYSIHFHCWTAKGFNGFLNLLQDKYFLPIEITLLLEREDEIVAILTKAQSIK